MSISKTKRISSTSQLTISAVLTAIGIIIPMFSPVKVILEPASFTLASHVPIFLAMFISPMTTIFVSLGTSIGFFLGGFPLPIVMRALSHVIFSVLGALWLQKHPSTIKSFGSAQIFSFVLALIHAFCEVLVASAFYFGGGTVQGDFTKTVLLLVGVGGVVHSIIDFNIAYFIYKALSKNREMKKFFI